MKEKINADKNIFGTEIRDIITIDGMRIVFDDGFALIRQSNTEPVFTLRFEAGNKEQADRLRSVMTKMLDDVCRILR